MAIGQEFLQFSPVSMIHTHVCLNTLIEGQAGETCGPSDREVRFLLSVQSYIGKYFHFVFSCRIVCIPSVGKQLPVCTGCCLSIACYLATFWPVGSPQGRRTVLRITISSGFSLFIHHFVLLNVSKMERQQTQQN
jgi:hypothetical protein